MDDREFEAWFAGEYPLTAQAIKAGVADEDATDAYEATKSGWMACSALSRSQDAPRCQCCGYLVTESEHQSCVRALSRSQDVARVALNDEQRRDIQECIDYLTPAAKDFSDLGMVGMGDSKHARCIRVLRSLLAPQPPQAGASESEKVMLDAILHGTGFMKDGKHVPREDVLAPAAPAEQPFGQWCKEEGKRLLAKCTPGKMVEDAPVSAKPLRRLAEAQRPLPADMAKVLHDNLPDLYLTDAPAEPKGEWHDDYEAKGTIEHLDLDNHRLRRAMQKIMARLAELLDEDQFANIESIVKEVGVEPPEQRAAPIGKVLSDAEMFDAKMDGKRGNVIWFNAPKPGFIYAAPAEQCAATLFCDLKSDAEKSNFFLSGRAYETGVIARAIQNDVAMAYHRCAEYAKQRAANKGGNDD
jgi:hypothetical protein